MSNYYIDIQYKSGFGTAEDISDLYNLTLAIDDALTSRGVGYVSNAYLERACCGVECYCRDEEPAEDIINEVISDFVIRSKRGSGSMPLLVIGEDDEEASWYDDEDDIDKASPPPTGLIH